MSKFEWLLRAQREFARSLNDWPRCYESMAVAVHFLMFEVFPDDPEGAVKEELYRWND